MTGGSIPRRKYFSECVVSLFSAGWGAFPPDQLHSGGKLDDTAAFIKDCHIYLICRRPSYSFDAGSFRFENGFFEGNLTYRTNGVAHSIPFKTPYHSEDGHFFEIAPYPHRRIIALDSQRKATGEFWMTDQVLISGVEGSNYRGSEVLYVGQAFGDGNRGVIERLRSHSTLQKILADVQSTTPDDEIRLFAFQYLDYQLITSMDGISKDTEITGDDDLEHLRNILHNRLSEREQICLVEAALIRYFQPKYNVIYRESFPAEDLKILQNCYSLDFAGLVVEINTEDLDTPLYSEVVSMGVHHIAKYDLHDIAKRRSFFSLVDREGRFTPSPGSGPAY